MVVPSVSSGGRSIAAVDATSSSSTGPWSSMNLAKSSGEAGSGIANIAAVRRSHELAAASRHESSTVVGGASGGSVADVVAAGGSIGGVVVTAGELVVGLLLVVVVVVAAASSVELLSPQLARASAHSVAIAIRRR